MQWLTFEYLIEMGVTGTPTLTQLKPSVLMSISNKKKTKYVFHNNYELPPYICMELGYKKYILIRLLQLISD